MRQIKYRLALLLFSLGLLTLGLLFLLFGRVADMSVEEEYLNRLELVAHEIASHIRTHLEEQPSIILTLASNPLLRSALQQSNHDYADLSDVARGQQLIALNQRWMSEGDEAAPLVQERLTNEVAVVLKEQMALFPDVYGEIFLTNRYGLVIGATARLTTIAHGNRYWWQGAYDEGRGKVYLDDRGFDLSVEGYVLGIVVPVHAEGEVIGILKANVNTLGLLHHMVDDFTNIGVGRLKVARANGEVVLEKDSRPLSTRLAAEVVERLQQGQSGSMVVHRAGKASLVGYAPIPLTMNEPDSGYRFGGRTESPGQREGYAGQGWFAVIESERNLSQLISDKIMRSLAFVGLLLMVMVAIIAYLLGSGLAKPIVMIARAADRIGRGNLDTRIILHRDDEIGALAAALNGMASNLQQTMASRDELEREVAQRKVAEERLHLLATTDDLTGIANRRFFNVQLTNLLERAQRYRESLALIMIDIDSFKSVNDNYGHDVGDRILVELVAVVTARVRHVDLLARWGGEEFMILLPQTDATTGRLLAERLCHDVEQHDFGEPKHLTISIGLTSLQGGDSLASITKRVDDALYQAKAEGRNRVEAL